MTKTIPTTEQAKIIRKVLREAFPQVKFSVRKQRGSSIDIIWADGPTTKQVDALVQGFAGGGFDGMTDSRYGITARWKGEAVRFGADFVFTRRRLSAEFIARYLDRAARREAVDASRLQIVDLPSGASLDGAGVDDTWRVRRRIDRYSHAVAQAAPTLRHLGTYQEAPGYAQR